ncbi:MAG TPA: DUF3592 domain-containing protein [Mesorhizobium sp.]|jgi:hypothetical protein|nr:DUF3592 domain-containing protein [Mesorhizobium sp.]
MNDEVGFYIVIAFFALAFIIAWLNHRLVSKAKNWPEVEAVVVARKVIPGEPPDYVLTVEYLYRGESRRSEVRNPYMLNEGRMRVGDKAIVKVDPSRPEVSILLRDLAPLLY